MPVAAHTEEMLNTRRERDVSFTASAHALQLIFSMGSTRRRRSRVVQGCLISGGLTVGVLVVKTMVPSVSGSVLMAATISKAKHGG